MEPKIISSDPDDAAMSALRAIESESIIEEDKPPPLQTSDLDNKVNKKNFFSKDVFVRRLSNLNILDVLIPSFYFVFLKANPSKFFSSF